MGSREDYEWSRDKMQRYDLPSRCHAVLFSPIFGRIDPREIVEWILADKTGRSFSTSDAQIHLEPNTAGCLSRGTLVLRALDLPRFHF